MKPSRPSRYRWFVVGTFFSFMLLHQSDMLLIGPLTTPIMETFHINEVQMGAVFTGSLIVGAFMYPLWGYLYDRFARAPLLALASLLWGATTWLSAIAPTFPAFLATRASTGIDNSSYPGLYSLIADYFGPEMRGKIYGLLNLTQALGYMIGMALAIFLGAAWGWRNIFYLTGGLGIVLAGLIFLFVREAPRGQSEPEMAGLQEVRRHRFSWPAALDLLRKPSLRLIFAQGFFGSFPWNVISYWFFRYMEKERGYSGDAVFVTMVVAVIVVAIGFPLGGALGDFAFKRTPRGRLIVSSAAVLIGAALMVVTMNIPPEQQGLFMLMLACTALFIPIASANVVATVYDVTLPEVRSTANGIESLIESAGSALAPLIAGAIAVQSSLHNAILLICLSTWVICGILFAAAAYVIPGDVHALRAQMAERAREERLLQDGRQLAEVVADVGTSKQPRGPGAPPRSPRPRVR